MSPITKRQKQIYDYIKGYIERKGFSPTFEEIKKHFKLSALSTVHQHIEVLTKKGMLSKNSYSARGIEISNKEQMVQIPLLGTIAAGQPIIAIQEKEVIALPKDRLPKIGNCYALRVSGQSMIDENIDDGDIVVVKNQSTAENGQKIVALIDNYEATLKKYYQEKNRVRLQPANKEYEPLIVDPANIQIQGIVIDVIKKTPPFIETSLIEKKIDAAEKHETEKNATLKKWLNTIQCLDCVEGMKKLPDNSCDVIIADPPYNIGKDFGNNKDKLGISEYIAWSKKWINECIRSMKPTGTMFIYGFSEILAHLSVEIPLEKRWLIWHYTNKNVASINFWQRSHEAIICCWKERPVFNRDKIREPYTEGFLNGAAGKVRKGTEGRFSKNGKETIYNAHDKGALPRDVIKIPALAGGAGMTERWFLCKTCKNVFAPKELKKHNDHNVIKHPTQKPFELSRKLIKSCMPPKNGIILVPFVGSGSECMAAKELGASYLGFEINPDYIKIANKILENTKCQQTLSLA